MRPALSWLRSTDAELFLYPGDQHLFLDSSLPGVRRCSDRRADGPGARLPGELGDAEGASGPPSLVVRCQRVRTVTGALELGLTFAGSFGTNVAV